MKRRKLSKKARQVISQFDDSAQSWGLMSDQGVGAIVGASRSAYESSLQTLERFILSLENRLRLRIRDVRELDRELDEVIVRMSLTELQP